MSPKAENKINQTEIENPISGNEKAVVKLQKRTKSWQKKKQQSETGASY